MKFKLIDRILEQTADRIVVLKQVSLAEEYLADHFPGFPVLPGVMMLETMTQAARQLLKDRSAEPMVMGEVKAFRFGAMVRPGDGLAVEVTVGEPLPDGQFPCRGTSWLVDPMSASRNGERKTAAAGRFTMRPLRCDR